MSPNVASVKTNPLLQILPDFNATAYLYVCFGKRKNLDANVSKISQMLKLSKSPAAPAQPRGKSLFASRSSLAQNTSRNFLRLDQELWSLLCCAQLVVGVFSRNDSHAGCFREISREKERDKEEKKEKGKRENKKRKNARLTRVCHTNQREIRALARQARAACESRSCIAVDHLVFAAMSNWPGCSGFAEISPAV